MFGVLWIFHIRTQELFIMCHLPCVCYHFELKQVSRRTVFRPKGTEHNTGQVGAHLLIHNVTEVFFPLWLNQIESVSVEPKIQVSSVRENSVHVYFTHFPSSLHSPHHKGIQ